MRQAGAQARAILLAAAAKQWNTLPSQCRASNGSIIHISTGRRIRYGQLVATASTLPPVKPEQAPLKDPRSFRYIGTPMPRVDIPAKVDGAAVFGIDAYLVEVEVDVGVVVGVARKKPTWRPLIWRVTSTWAQTSEIPLRSNCTRNACTINYERGRGTFSRPQWSGRESNPQPQHCERWGCLGIPGNTATRESLVIR